MILFTEFYTKVLMESHYIDKVPRNILGMTSNPLDLPDKQPYGFWVDRSGNFMQVPLYAHSKALSHLLNRTRDYLEAQDIEHPNFKYQYTDLLDIGWTRVVLSPDSVLYEVGKGQQLTFSQKKFLHILKDLYDKKYIIRDPSQPS